MVKGGIKVCKSSEENCDLNLQGLFSKIVTREIRKMGKPRGDLRTATSDQGGGKLKKKKKKSKPRRKQRVKVINGIYTKQHRDS